MTFRAACMRLDEGYREGCIAELLAEITGGGEWLFFGDGSMVLTSARLRRRPIEHTLEVPLPRTESQVTFSDGHHHFAPHDLTLQIRVTEVI